MEKILKNPIYCGIMDIWGDHYKGSFDPIVSVELFNRCNGGYRRNSRLIHRNPSNPEFPLRRMTVCTFRNLSLTGSFSTGRRRPILRTQENLNSFRRCEAASDDKRHRPRHQYRKDIAVEKVLEI